MALREAMDGLGEASRPKAEEARETGAAWLAVGVLLLLYGLAFVDRQIISLLVAPIRHDLGVSDFQISLLQGFAFALLYSTCGLPLGLAADRLPRRWVVFGGVMVWALSATACGLAHSFTQLLIARFFVGMGEAALAPAAYSMLSDLFPAKRLTFALSIYSIGALMGSAASLAVGATVVRGLEHGLTLPVLGHLHSWQAAFLVTGVPGIAIAFLIFVIPEPARGGGRSSGGDWRELFAFIRSRAAFLSCHAIGFGAVMTMAYAQIYWAPTFLVRTYGWPVATAGYVLAGFGLTSGALAFLFSGRMVDGLQRRGMTDGHFRFYIVATALAGIAGALAFQSHIPLVFFALMLVPTVPLNMAAIGASALQIVTPPALRGRMSALYLMVSGLMAMTLGPSTVALFTEHVFHRDSAINLSLSATFLLYAPIALAAFVLGLKPMREAVARAKSA